MIEEKNNESKNETEKDNAVTLIFIGAIVAISAVVFLMLFLNNKDGGSSTSTNSGSNSYSRSKRHKFPVKQKKQEIQNNDSRAAESAENQLEE